MNQDDIIANIRPDTVVDAYGLLCPIPIMKVAQKIKSLPSGSVLEVIATDGGIDVDLANWCKSHKHIYLGCRQEGRLYRVFLQVNVEASPIT
jgi:TusA-related sulfurtransferase